MPDFYGQAGDWLIIVRVGESRGFTALSTVFRSTAGDIIDIIPLGYKNNLHPKISKNPDYRFAVLRSRLYDDIVYLKDFNYSQSILDKDGRPNTLINKRRYTLPESEYTKLSSDVMNPSDLNLSALIDKRS